MTVTAILSNNRQRIEVLVAESYFEVYRLNEVFV